MREVASTGNSNKLVPTCIDETREMMHAVIYDKTKIPTNKQVSGVKYMTVFHNVYILLKRGKGGRGDIYIHYMYLWICISNV